MKNLLLLLCSLLLNGVFGDGDEVNVSVKEGDSVTLKIKPEDINKDSSLVWKKMSDNPDIIGRLSFETQFSKVYDTPDKIFGERLKLNNQTGDLTITNIRYQHSGEYKLEIKGSKEKIKTFRVFVSEVIKLSVMEGDSYTLKTGVTDGKNVKWKFNGAELADSRFTNTEVNQQTGNLKIANIRSDQSGEYKVEINGRGFISHKTYSVKISEVIKLSVMEGDSLTLQTGVTDGQIDDVKWKFNGVDLTLRLSDSSFSNTEVNEQTGNLKIRNIRSDQSGEYRVEINGRGFISHKTYRVNFSGVLETVSGKVGDSVILHTDTEKYSDDVIEWKLNSTVIFQSDQVINDVRFKNRLKLKDESGSLYITNIRSEDSGLYEFDINGSRHILHRKINFTAFTLNQIQRSNGEKTGPGLLVVLILMGIIVIV